MASPRLSITICWACTPQANEGEEGESRQAGGKRPDGGGLRVDGGNDGGGTLVDRHMRWSCPIHATQHPPSSTATLPTWVLAEMSARFSRRQKLRWKAG